jgi:hypothetical protein
MWRSCLPVFLNIQQLAQLVNMLSPKNQFVVQQAESLQAAAAGAACLLHLVALQQ